MRVEQFLRWTKIKLYINLKKEFLQRADQHTRDNQGKHQKT